MGCSRAERSAIKRHAERSAGAACGPTCTNTFQLCRYVQLNCCCSDLPWQIRCDAGNGPDKPSKLARDRGDNDLLQLVFRHHLPVTLAQPGLRLPGDRAYRIGHCVDGLQLTTGDAGRETVAVSPLDQQGPGMDVAGPRVKRPRASLGDGTDTPALARRMLRRHQAEIGHKVGGGRKARGVTPRLRTGSGGSILNAD